MKKVLLVCLFVINLIADNCDREKLFWDEIKNSRDIKDFRYYNKKYPNGIYEYIANKNIKQLKKSNNTIQLVKQRPSWIKGYSQKYKFYGVGKANKHFKGKDYQDNLASNRAKKELQAKFNNSNLTNKQIYNYKELIQIIKYIDDKGRVYILLFIDNYDL
jgi:hypothetical protein